MGVEELGLGLSAVTTLTVPPTGSIRVQISTVGTLDSNTGAGDLKQRSLPFFVSPGRLSLEDNLLTQVRSMDTRGAPNI